MLTGEAPAVAATARGARLRGLRRVRRLGVRAGARARDAAAHEPRRARTRGPRAPARGDGLAGADARVDQPGPGRPPGLADQASGGPAGDDPYRRRAEDPVHQRHPRRHRRVRGGPHGVARGARRVRAHPGGHPPELRPAPRYYGEEPAEIATDAAERYWAHRPLRGAPPRRADVGLPGDDRRHGAARAGGAPPDARASASRSRRTSPTGGRSWCARVRPTSAGCRPTATTSRPSTRSRRRSRCASASTASPRSTERLCVYPQYMTRSGSRRACWTSIQDQLPHVHAAPRPRRRVRAARRSQRARDGRALAPEELEAMFAESRPEVIEDMRQAADELRDELAGDLVTFVVNRNINVSNICTVGCAFCGFGVSQALAGRLRALAGRLRAPRPRRASTSARPRSACSPASTPTGALRTTSAGCGWPRRPRREIHLHAYSPMEIAHMCDVSGLPPRRGLRAAARGRPGQRARHRGRGAARRRPPAHQPEQAAGRALGGDHHRRPRGRPALDRDRDVRPHRDARRAGRAHARRARRCRTRTGGFTEFVPLSLHPVPDAARPHARHRRDLARGEPQAHGGVPARARARRSRRCRRAG